jgi:hypothetical protein
MNNKSIVGLSIVEPFLFSPFPFLAPYLHGSTIVEILFVNLFRGLDAEAHMTPYISRMSQMD